MAYLALMLCALFFAHPASAQSRDSGTLRIQIKDHREALGDFSKAELVLESILVSPKSGLKFWRTRWKELRPSVERVDLTKYTENRSATVFKGELAAGSFDAIQLKVKEVAATLKKNKSGADVKSLLGPIKLGFSVKPKETTLVVLDLTVREMTDHPPRGYELQLKGYEVYSNGKLVEKVPPG